ncbi:MAG: hypothetical protein CO042_01035 [Parcubacteria group bacterium CG_4_9_14_0_2_um_filter_41_8]|nr:MAG: hypothetical protein AUJ34_03005 [Parcubacteria group bacterium CG1_02_41_12]PIQ80388.1 MAG: hypothetical protein COV79_00670 [Parcubacteria group bacterium CG11_big_fil_rev_8_21_14_0_20_41_14]PIR57255.1 MAG: hypothetical protein COU72_01855 [Parcubacteria group bacterium CG10_big_fil_rev_8_21_14_0_10_41_35]PIZ80874.1 MAG: hypothetical protein COY02_03355 [Parcubacteria group bacterium CG_4_10_14_0_2_um_filter_41_6]PJC40951.1 MAG: hypothetical protein CO042_01035 [Parcubacteria group ba
MDASQNKTQQEIDNAPVAYKEFSEAMALVATKEQYDDLKKKMRDEFEKAERRMGNIEANMATKEDINRLTNTVESVLKKYIDYEIEETVHAKNHKNTEDILENHEKRITGLEAAPAGLA